MADIDNESCSNSDVDDNEETTEEEIQFFKKCLKDFLTLQQEIKAIESALKIRNEKRKKLSESIHTFIQENEVEHINLQGEYSGKQIQRVINKRKTPLNEKTIGEALHTFYGDNSEQANKVLEAIINSRKEIKTEKIELCNIGGNKKKSKSKQISELLDDDEETSEIPESMKHLFSKV